jgi:hypothetical protein
MPTAMFLAGDQAADWLASKRVLVTDSFRCKHEGHECLL